MIRYSIEKKYTALVLIVLLLIFGYVSFQNLPLDLLPDLELPVLVVVTQDEGATPEAMEVRVTQPLERLLASAEGLKEMNSISSEGRSLVILNFFQGQNMDSALMDVNNKIGMLEELWQRGTTKPMVLRINPSMLPVMVMAVYSEELDREGLASLFDEKLRSKLEGIDGVANVDASGLFRKEVELLLSQEKIHQKNQEMLTKIEKGLQDKEGELQEARERIAAGKSALSSASFSVPSPSFSTDGLEESLKLGQRLTEISLQKAALEVQQAALRQVHELLENPPPDLLELQALIQGYLPDFPFQLSEENMEQALKWVKGTQETVAAELSKLQVEEGELQARMESVTAKVQQLAQAQSQMMSQAASAMMQAQAASSELTRMEALLDTQSMMLEARKEEALAAANLSKLISVDHLSRLLQAQNIAMPIGYLYEGDERVPLKQDNPLNQEEILNLMLVDTGEEALGKLYVRDFVELKESDNRDQFYAKVNGRDALLLTLFKQSRSNTRNVSLSIHQAMQELQKEDGKLQMTPLMDQGEYIGWVVEAILKNIGIGALLAMAVLFFFLRDLRFTLLVALSIPVSIVFALVLMYFSNLSLNLISLAGLALGVGMMVDNSIVVLENTHRLRALGASPKEAAWRGAKEMAPAITASTLTTAFVFLPIFFTRGIARELFTDMALTIAYSLFASLVVALTLIPVASSLLRHKPLKVKQDSPFYAKSLDFSLRFPWLILGVSLLLLLSSFFLLLQKGSVFLPAMDTPQLSMTMSMKEQGSKEKLYELTDEVLKRLQTLSDISFIGAMDRRGFMESGGTDSMSFYMLRDEDSTKKGVAIESEIRQKLQDLPLDLTIQAQSNLEVLGGSGLTLRILGDDREAIKAYGKSILEPIRALAGIEKAELSLQEAEEEWILRVNREKAMGKSLTPAEIFMSLNQRLRPAKVLMELQNGLNLRVKLLEDQAIQRKDLLDLTVTNSKGEEVLLKEVASLQASEQSQQIQRFNQKRFVEIQGSLKKDWNISLVSREIDGLLKDYPTPKGIELKFTGEREQMDSTMKDLLIMLLLAIVIIYGIMVIQFQSLRAPFIVLFTIPLAFTGGALALLFTGKTISVIAMLGFLVLSGVIVNNGIVFVDTAARTEGDIKEVLRRTGQMRSRPIFMTALTTILGLIPIALSFGTGAEALQSIGLVILGGLLYATVMTLYVIPVLYYLFFKNKRKEAS